MNKKNANISRVPLKFSERETNSESWNNSVQLHKLWRDTNGHDGQRILLTGEFCEGHKSLLLSDLIGADFKNATFNDINFASDDLTATSFIDTSFWNVDFSSADLSHSVFENCLFNGSTSFRNSVLQESKFSVGLSREDSTLFGGADLTGAKFYDDKHYASEIKYVSELSKNAKPVFILIISACLFVWLTISTTKDIDYFINASVASLPIIGTEISTVGFYLISPLILLGIYVYFHVYLQRIWESLGRLPAIFATGRCLDRSVYPWLLIGSIYDYFPVLKAHRPYLASLQIYICFIGAWALVPITVLSLLLRFLPSHDLFRLTVLLVIFLCSLVFGISFIQGLRIALLGPSPSRNVNSIITEGRFLSIVIIVPIIIFIAISSNFNLGPDLTELELQGKNFTGKNLQIASFQNSELSQTDFSNANLLLADFQYVKARHAKFDWANMAGVNLRNGDFGSTAFKNSNLKWAELTSANLANSDFSFAILEEASLDHVNARGAVFNLTTLRGASLIYAELPEAIIVTSDFSGAKLSGSNLSRAILNQSNFTSAVFNTSGLQRLSQDIDRPPLIGPV